MSRNQSDPPNHHADPQKSSRRSTEKPKSAATLLTLIPKLMGSPYCHAVKYGLEKKKPDQVVNPLRNYPQVINMCMDVFFHHPQVWCLYGRVSHSLVIPPWCPPLKRPLPLRSDSRMTHSVTSRFTGPLWVASRRSWRHLRKSSGR
jgi:hypothetical protein